MLQAFRRSYYTVSSRYPYFKGLCELLPRIGVKVWLELSSRCSVLVPGALDVAVRMFAGTYAEPEASQYLLSQWWVPETWHGKYRNMISCRHWVPPTVGLVSVSCVAKHGPGTYHSAYCRSLV